MTEILGFETGLSVGGVSEFLGFYLMLFAILVVVGILAAGVIWWWYNKKIYNKDIIVYENIAGQGWKITFRDKAKHLRLSKDGTEVLCEIAPV